MTEKSSISEITFFVTLGPMIEIIHDQVVYNSGSNLEVSCIYRNSTGVANTLFGNSHSHTDDEQQRRQDAVLRMIENARRTAKEREHANKVPSNTIIWLHNGSIFSLRNRRRVKNHRKHNGDIHSVLSIKSAILSDSGNYSCVRGPLLAHQDTRKSPINKTILATKYVSDTVRLVVVNGEHSAAIYNKEGTNGLETELDFHQNLHTSSALSFQLFVNNVVIILSAILSILPKTTRWNISI